MRAISISCPNCGATLRYLGGKTGTCDYCHYEFPIRDEINSRIKRAFQLIAASNYSQAVELLQEAAEMDYENGQVFFAMLLCDLCVNSASKLAKVGRDFTRMPNYQKAIQYLDPSSKAELEQLAQMNKDYTETLKGGVSRYPTPLMNQFNKANNVVVSGKQMSIVTMLSLLMKKDFETKMKFVTAYRDQIENVIVLYRQLSDRRCGK